MSRSALTIRPTDALLRVAYRHGHRLAPAFGYRDEVPVMSALSLHWSVEFLVTQVTFGSIIVLAVRRRFGVVSESCWP